MVQVSPRVVQAVNNQWICERDGHEVQFVYTQCSYIFFFWQELVGAFSGTKSSK